MCLTICISIILLFFACCSYPKQHSSSYFKYSFLKDPLGGSLGVQGFRAGSELACALRCDRDNRCNEAIFDMASKKCSLHHKRDKCSRDSDVDEENEKSRFWKMTKVRNYIKIQLHHFSQFLLKWNLGKFWFTLMQQNHQTVTLPKKNCICHVCWGEFHEV